MPAAGPDPGRGAPVTDDDLSRALASPARLSALWRTGLDAVADPAFDRFADMVRKVLGVPVALVSLVDEHRQIFPGACGLAEPWAGQRQTPLSHSFCQHVVQTAEPLVITDAREDPRVRDNLAIGDLGVVGYAGMPLTDADGLVLGSLCAIDVRPHEWTPRELDLLADLAAACSDSLRLRIATGSARRGEQAARAELDDAGAAYDRSQLLLRAAIALSATSTVDDVVRAVRHLVTGTLDPAFVGLSLLDGPDAVVLTTSEALPPEVAARWARFRRTASTSAAIAATTGSVVVLPDPEAIAELTPDAADTYATLGWQSGASVPLPGPAGPIGALTFVWKQQNAIDDTEAGVLSVLAGYVAQALRRATAHDDRRTAAATMQKALLSELPRHDHLRLAARYLPAHHADHVGGDWYDAIAIDDRRLALVIGDVTGHHIEAAAAMSQLRSMLRALLVDRQESPASMLRRLEHTRRVLGSDGLASVILAYVDTKNDGSHVLTWANAGHPPPALRAATGAVDILDGTDPLLGATRHASRRNHSVALPPGSVLLLYTDGLVEDRDAVIDDGIAAVCRRLSADDGTDPEQLADALLAGKASYEDDVALLTVRLPD